MENPQKSRWYDALNSIFRGQKLQVEFRLFLGTLVRVNNLSDDYDRLRYIKKPTVHS